MKHHGVLLFSCLSALAFLFGLGWRLTDEVSRYTAVSPKTAVLIDAGHGGFDGGAVAVDGTLEKDINLAVATDLSSVLRLLGYPVRMTRETDTALCEDAALSIRERKRSDMAQRLEMYNQAAITVSIHQNYFTQSSSCGTQVFYATGCGESRALASAVRESVITRLQPENHRELKEGTRDVLLLYKTDRPAILVECGFLSNPDEREKLKNQAYRLRMAMAIAEGIVQYQP